MGLKRRVNVHVAHLLGNLSSIESSSVSCLIPVAFDNGVLMMIDYD